MNPDPPDSLTFWMIVQSLQQKSFGLMLFTLPGVVLDGRDVVANVLDIRHS